MQLNESELEDKSKELAKKTSVFMIDAVSGDKGTVDAGDMVLLALTADKLTAVFKEALMLAMTGQIESAMENIPEST